MTGSNWIGEQGRFLPGLWRSAFDRVKDPLRIYRRTRTEETFGGLGRRSSSVAKDLRNRKRRRLTDADIAAVEDSGAGALEDSTTR